METNIEERERSDDEDVALYDSNLEKQQDSDDDDRDDNVSVISVINDDHNIIELPAMVGNNVVRAEWCDNTQTQFDQIQDNEEEQQRVDTEDEFW